MVSFSVFLDTELSEENKSTVYTRTVIVWVKRFVRNRVQRETSGCSTNGPSTGSKTVLTTGKTLRHRYTIKVPTVWYTTEFPPIVNEFLYITEKLTVQSTEE